MHWLERVFGNVVEFVEGNLLAHNESDVPDIRAGIRATAKYAEFGKAMANVPRLHGLVIGINNYNKRSSHACADSTGNRAPLLSAFDAPTFTNLRGAVADAERFYKYLTSQVGVPEQQIKFLCDEKATRAEIIKAFQELADKNNGIRAGDSIVIFYAGHGAQALPPKRLVGMPGCPQFVELLVPYDFNDDPSKRQYMGIPDYTLAALLNSIGKFKGDNITVIFDCCHSASALRGARNITTDSDLSEPITRTGPELDFHIPDELDEDIWGGTRALTVPAQLRYSGAASYVFFSACASFELAKEQNGQGCFTSALLNLLQAADSHKLQCSQIIQRLRKIEGQNPQCEGLHINRSIFHGFVSPNTRKFFNVRVRGKSTSGPFRVPDESENLAEVESADGDGSRLPRAPTTGAVGRSRPTKFVLDGGTINGLSVGDEFTVYRSQSEGDQNEPVGHLVIEQIFDNRAYLRICDKQFTLPCIPAPALRTKCAHPHLQLFIDEHEESYSELVSRVDSSSLRDAGIIVTAEREKAHIALSKESSQLRFDVVDAVLVERQIECAHHLVDDTEDLSNILEGLAHYYWHLKRGSDFDRYNAFPAESGVDVSLFELDPNITPYFRPLSKAPNLCKSGVIEVEVDGPESDDEYEDDDEREQYDHQASSFYGMELKNNSQWDLYPALFYFDNSKFTITSTYQPPTSKAKSEPPLKKGQTMTIGYGLGAGATVPPFQFYLSNRDVNMESGFFKLVLSTQPIDLLNMLQESPVFESARAIRRHVQSATSSTSWSGSLTILVVQKLRMKD